MAKTSGGKTKQYRCSKCGEVYGYAYSTCPGCGAKCEAVGGNDATVQDARDGSAENGLTSRERFFLNGVRQLLSKGTLTDDDRAFLDSFAVELGIYASRRDILIGQARCEINNIRKPASRKRLSEMSQSELLEAMEKDRDEYYELLNQQIEASNQRIEEIRIEYERFKERWRSIDENMP